MGEPVVFELSAGAHLETPDQPNREAAEALRGRIEAALAAGSV